MKNLTKSIITLGLLVSTLAIGYAQNPIITNQFTADPTARVFGDSVYLYPSHDIVAPDGMGLRKDWFCMEDYHVFSSVNLTQWSDKGVIISQNKTSWVRPNSFSMWAPDCVKKNGKYYFYFPAPAADTIYGKGFSIGVAVSESPAGPFIPQPKPIIGVHGIDPCVLIDPSGQAYLYWSARNIYMARLKDNMTELASEVKIIPNLPEKGLKEGPFVFERNGLYYLTFPHVENRTERLEYAMSNSPEGPFKMSGVIMDEAPNGCWTNHHSIVNFKNQWYLFYHQNDLSPKFDKNRSVRIDSLFFNEDGNIQKVIPTIRGVGITPASSEIQPDRYSNISGVTVAFNDTLNSFSGWKSIFSHPGDWIQYNAVDFAKGNYKSVQAKVYAVSDAILEIHLDHPQGALIAEIKIPAGTRWDTIKSKVQQNPKGTHNLVIKLKEGSHVELDWLQYILK